MKKLKSVKLLLAFLIALMLFFTNSMAAFATILVGASAESSYQTMGNCAHGDRVAGIYVTNFLNEITYDPWIGDPAANTLFNYHDEWAWEVDLLFSSPYYNVNDVDFMVFSGHGYVQGFHNVPYNSLHYFTLNSSTNFHPAGESGESLDAANVDSWEVWWGYGSAITKWVTTYTCNFLNTSGDYWASIMQGVHLVMGFGSTMYIHSEEGAYYGLALRQGYQVKTAFFEGNRLYQPYNSTPTICRVLGAEISQNDTIKSYSRKPAPIGGDDRYYYWTLTVQPR